MNRTQRRVASRKKRADRIRKKVLGTAERPRLCVRRSLRHVIAQIVDDVAGRCLLQVTSSAKFVAEKSAAAGKKATKTDISKLVGELVAEKAKEKGITKVVFDRKGHLYHGRVKAVADGARSKGLVF